MYRKWVSLSVAVVVMAGAFSSIGLAVNPSASQPTTPAIQCNDHRTDLAFSQARQVGYNSTLVIAGIIFGKYTDMVTWGPQTNVACDVGKLKVLGICDGNPMIALLKDFYVAYIQVFLGYAHNGRMFGFVFSGRFVR